MGVGQREQGGGIVTEFNDWIVDLEVEHVPSVGRKFTWYRPNGTAKSRLDRILVSVEWFSKWSGSTQFILDRNYSNHCPILLKSIIADWSLKPFKTLDCWLQDKSFRKTIQIVGVKA